ncbi:methylmalonyl-CoA decarboxylase [Rhodoblastus sp. 17X3]|uniref:methylmalonyl-CoA decarboxylase n=1 Tax=Rhodoblastus sp. 17X3 TaxID=3047026 RepID=UPI0024B6B60A|nr:methylmalonyl-CoA decarboxylase [Rhodoblastus sp. 17X3]MDI9849098.1 methylmalonyl-CoA decarboxylase [Rhodoblastus sp. 17X3]
MTHATDDSKPATPKAGPETTPPLIQTSFQDHVGIIAFDHYSRRNALSQSLIAAVLAAFETFKSRQARVVILRAAQNEKVWSAGHSVDELPKADIDPLPYDDPLEQLLRAVKRFPAPVVAMVHGSVWGGACDLVLACDLVVADETATFAITPAKIGVPYNIVGILNFMSQLPLSVVKEMFFTADPIDARRAERIGLVNRLAPPDALEAETLALARKIASRSPAAISTLKEAMRALSAAAPITPDTYEYLQGLRRKVYFGPDYREGIAAFLEKRPARF